MRRIPFADAGCPGQGAPLRESRESSRAERWATSWSWPAIGPPLPSGPQLSGHPSVFESMYHLQIHVGTVPRLIHLGIMCLRGAHHGGCDRSPRRQAGAPPGPSRALHRRTDSTLSLSGGRPRHRHHRLRRRRHQLEDAHRAGTGRRAAVGVRPGLLSPRSSTSASSTRRALPSERCGACTGGESSSSTLSRFRTRSGWATRSQGTSTVAAHLPPTARYSWRRLQTMLDAKEGAILKPRVGSLGLGIAAGDAAGGWESRVLPALEKSHRPPCPQA